MRATIARLCLVPLVIIVSGCTLYDRNFVARSLCERSMNCSVTEPHAALAPHGPVAETPKRPFVGVLVRPE